MKEAIVYAGPKVKIVDSPIPKLATAEQVLIKVIVAGANPKDWKRPETGGPHNSGDDLAGIVEAVGENVYEFRPGDRVAAFHKPETPHGSYAEYALVDSHVAFHLPKNITFEEAATIPLAAMTAAYGLYYQLNLPALWHGATTPLPLIVNGGATSVGAFVIKLAQRSNIHPIITVAGRGQELVESLISREKGDTIVDYRKGDVTTGLREAIKSSGAGEVKYAIDCVGDATSYKSVYPVLAKGSRMAFVAPRQPYTDVPDSVEVLKITVPAVHDDLPADLERAKIGLGSATKDFGYTFYRLFSKGIKDGWLTPHPYELVPGGLNGIEESLTKLKTGKTSAVKYVFRIEDTK